MGVCKQALSNHEVPRDSGVAPCVGPYGSHILEETHYLGVLPINGRNSPNPRSTNSGESTNPWFGVVVQTIDVSNLLWGFHSADSRLSFDK